MLRDWLKTSWLLLWSRVVLLNGSAMGLLSIAVIIIGLAATSWVKRHPWFEIKELVITGMRGNLDLSHQNTTLIQQTLMKRLRGNLFTVNLQAVQAVFAQTPWIRHVEVRRVWPNRLWVIVEEHQAVAKLNEDLLVNQQGEVFLGVSASNRVAENLPQWYGAPQDVAVMQTRFQELNQWLAPKQLTVQQLSFSERRAWTAQLSNQIILDLGRDDLRPAAQERVQHWADTWAIAQQTANLKSGLRIDLRYPNGYAVSRAP